MFVYFFKISCKYIMYVLNVSIYVNELVFPPTHSVLVYQEYSNANIGPC